MLPNYHIIKVVTTNSETYGARVRITSDYKGQSITIPFSNEAGASNPAIDTAEIYLKQRGFNLIGKGAGRTHYYLISDTFEPIK